MKISGITRKLDKLGRVVIPMDVRRSLDWKDETVIEISQFGRYLLLHAEKDRQSVPIELGTASPVLHDIMSTLPQLSDQDALMILELMQRLVKAPR